MHEMSVAQSLLEIIRQNVPEEDLHDVRRVKMKVGDIAGVVTDSLEFCFQAIVAETSLSQSSLLIERIPFQIRCNVCSKTSSNEQGFVFCPHCGSGDTLVLSGSELQVVEIELEDNVKESV